MLVTLPAILHKEQTVIQEEKVISMEKYWQGFGFVGKIFGIVPELELRNVRRKKLTVHVRPVHLVEYCNYFCL
jgi:hypothetical protein